MINEQQQIRVDSEESFNARNLRFCEMEQQLKAEATARYTAESQLTSEKEMISKLQEQLKSYQNQSNKLNDIQTKLSETEERLQAEIQTRSKAEKEIEVERKSKNKIEQELKNYKEQLAEEKSRQVISSIEEPAETPIEKQTVSLNESSDNAERTRTCECCENDNIKENKLVKINSGQLLCTECYNALKSSAVS